MLDYPVVQIAYFVSDSTAAAERMAAQFGASPFRAMYKPGHEGIHHIAMMVDSLTGAYQQCASMGYKIAARAETLTGTAFAFVDTVDTMGHMIEIYEKSEGLLGFYEMVRQASVDWDGKDPVRKLG